MSGDTVSVPDQCCALEQATTSAAESDRKTFDDQPWISGHVSWEWDIPGNMVYFSREWQYILRSQDEGMLGGSTAGWWPRVHEDDVVPFLDMARDIVEGRTECYQTLFRVRRCDGAWAWLLSRGRVTETAEGKAVRVAGALMDVSDLRADVKFLHGSSAASDHAMLENSPDVIIRMDRELTPLFMNPRVARQLTRMADAASGEEGVTPAGIRAEQMAFLRENVKTVFEHGAAVRKEVTFPTAYGHTVTGEYSFWPEFDGEGEVAGVMTQFRDLTEQVLAERRARLNETRLDALYRLTQMYNAPEADVLRFVMDSLVRLTGSENGFLFFPHSFPGGRGRVVWSENHYAILDEALLPEGSLPAEYLPLIVDADGKNPTRSVKNGNSLHPLRIFFEGKMKIMRYVLVPAMDGDRVVCVAGVCNKETDYTEADLQQVEAFLGGAWLILRRHVFIRELQRAKNAAEHANKVKDEFLANVSHELRTPLHGILTMLQLIDLLPLTEQQREYVRLANESGQSLMRIISDILEFSRMESHLVTLRCERFDLRGTIAAAVNFFRQEAEKKGVQLDVSLDERIPERLLGDSARVRQILINVVGNALKFTERGSIEVLGSLLPARTPGKIWVYISVRDTGIGIPDEYQSTIFEAFTQVDGSATRKYAGTGLGLSIVRRLVRLMGGGISVESELGRGTTLHISLCFAVAPDIPVSAPRAAEEAEETSHGPLDVLVAEDDPTGRFAMRAFLQIAGHRPVCVSNGRLALEVLKLHPFDCLFTDIQMPEMDGLEVIRRIRENRTEDIVPSEEARAALRDAIPGEYETLLPIPDDLLAVSVSAHVMSGDKERFLQAGMDFYLSKPVIMSELTAVLGDIRALLARKAVWLR